LLILSLAILTHYHSLSSLSRTSCLSVWVKLKALKLYINSYRDRYISHEESANQILDDFVAACDPLEVTVKADFTPRGNVHTVVEVHHQK